MSFGSATKQSDSFTRRIPRNPKYDHIKPQIDTGASLSAYMQKIEDIRKNYRYRQDEIFKRMKVTTFAQLVLQVAFSEEYMASPETCKAGSHSGGVVSPLPVGGRDHIPDAAPLDVSPGQPPPSARSTLSDLVTGIGQLDMGPSSPLSPEAGLLSMPTAPPPNPSPYLLLDTREKDDFDQCHIIGAHHYPAAVLTRSCNYFTKEILEYRNKRGRVIIVYDEDERIAPKVASTFVQRDVENVFMLSGGMKVLYKTFPNGMLTGSIPKTCLPSPPTSARKGSGKRSAPPPTSPSVPGPLKDTFTDDDLDAIQTKLDEVLLAAEASSSSRASSQRSTSTTSSRATVSSIRPSGKESAAPTPRPWK